jgi:formate-dependent nitrite reductase membrane component NrfD
MQARAWEFGVKESPAREWSEGMGALIAVAMFLGGIAGGLYLASLYFNNIWGMLVAWIFAMGMGLFDFAHLSKPMRVWRIAFRAGSSWISRGFIFVILFIGAAGLQLLIHVLTGSGANPGGLEIFFRVVAGILAFGVAIYSGFVIGFVNGIKFWNSAIMPLLVVLGGLAGGMAILLPAASMMAPAGLVPFTFANYQTFAVLGLIAYTASIFIHLWVSTYNGPAARDSAILLLKGNMAGLFWILIILIGIIIPLILEITVGTNTVLLCVNAALVLIGNLTLRYSIIKAGRYSPLVPA